MQEVLEKHLIPSRKILILFMLVPDKNSQSPLIKS